MFQLSRAMSKKTRARLYSCGDDCAVRMALPFHSVYHTDRDLLGCASLLKFIHDLRMLLLETRLAIAQ